ncbi:MAG: DUF1326 domain-containing protein [Nitriliruptorales bacterium]
MATWAIEGQWFTNCNCDPGCPCDFNQVPTHGDCAGVDAMHVERGHFGDVSLDGANWAHILQFPSAPFDGNGHRQPVLDEALGDDQRDAIATILTGTAGGLLFEIYASICPHVHDPLVAPFEWEWDLEQRRGRLKAGDYIEVEASTLTGIGSDEPYQVRIQIPGGFEYTNPTNSVEVAEANLIRVDAGVDFEYTRGHCGMAPVSHAGTVP